MLPLAALISSDKSTLKLQIDLGALWSPCWLSGVPGNVLCFEVKEDKKQESLLERYPAWCCVIWSIAFSEGFDMEHGLMEGVQNPNKSGSRNNTPTFNGSPLICKKSNVQKQGMWVLLIPAVICSAASI